MGVGMSGFSTVSDDIRKLQKLTTFTHEQLENLYDRFRCLDRSDSGALNHEAFLAIPELAMNPLATRMIEVMDEEGEGDVNFIQFARMLAIFSDKASKDDKLIFAFKVYDLNNDGFIDMAEMIQIMRRMVGKNIPNKQLEVIAMQTIKAADADKDGKLSFDEFRVSLNNVDIGMTLQF